MVTYHWSGSNRDWWRYLPRRNEQEIILLEGLSVFNMFNEITRQQLNEKIIHNYHYHALDQYDSFYEQRSGNVW